jgi:pimeloyl-ACP methyl ester carboxylesterase
MLQLTYYPGSEGKKTVPIILLHGVEGPIGEGSGRDCAGLATYLQQQKHAVFVPDLRGFGSSKIQRYPDGSRKTLDADRFRRGDIVDMVQQDLEALRRVIVDRHNKGELNASLMCVVGFELGSLVALNWADLDWSIPSLPNLKQGRDVIGIVLVSPVESYKGVSIRDALDNPGVRSQISAMVVFGAQNQSASASGRQLHKMLQKFHPPVPKDDEDRQRYQDLFVYELPTSLQGTKLLSSPDLQLPQLIGEFIQLRIVDRRDEMPWGSRARK